MAEEDPPDADVVAVVAEETDNDLTDDQMKYEVRWEGYVQIHEFLNEIDPVALGDRTKDFIDAGFYWGLMMADIDRPKLADLGITDEALVKKILAKRAWAKDHEEFNAYYETWKAKIFEWSIHEGKTFKDGKKVTYADKWGVDAHDSGLFGRDGIWLTACSSDGFAFLWPADHPDPLPPCVRCIQSHLDVCFDSCTDFRKMLMVTCGGDCKCVLTDLETGKRLVSCKSNLQMHGSNSFLCVDADFDTGRCAVGTVGAGGGGEVKIFDLEAGALVMSMKGAMNDVYDVKLDVASGTAVACSWDHNLYSFDTRAGKRTKTLKGHNASVNKIQVDFAEQIAVSVAEETTMILWDLAAGRAIKEYEVQCGSQSLAVDFERLRAATGDFDGCVRFWDLESAECTKVIDCELFQTQCIDVYWDMGLVLAGSADHQVKLFDYHSGGCLKKFRKSRRCINQVCLKKTGGHVPMDHDGTPLWHLAVPNKLETK